MKFARTVCGDIQAEEMGFTYPHEHLYAVPPTCQKDRDLEVSDYEGSVAELKLFKSVGGQTLVEASTLDYGRNLSLLKKMSEETGVHVIATTGFNKHIYYPNWVEEKSTEEISDILADDILEGRDGIRAGFIKIGTYYNMIHPNDIDRNEKVVSLRYTPKNGTILPLPCLFQLVIISFIPICRPPADRPIIHNLHDFHAALKFYLVAAYHRNQCLSAAVPLTSLLSDHSGNGLVQHL